MDTTRVRGLMVVPIPIGMPADVFMEHLKFQVFLSEPRVEREPDMVITDVQFRAADGERPAEVAIIFGRPDA